MMLDTLATLDARYELSTAGPVELVQFAFLLFMLLKMKMLRQAQNISFQTVNGQDNCGCISKCRDNATDVVGAHRYKLFGTMLRSVTRSYEQTPYYNVVVVVVVVVVVMYLYSASRSASNALIVP